MLRFKIIYQYHIYTRSCDVLKAHTTKKVYDWVFTWHSLLDKAWKYFLSYNKSFMFLIPIQITFIKSGLSANLLYSFHNVLEIKQVCTEQLKWRFRIRYILCWITIISITLIFITEQVLYCRKTSSISCTKSQNLNVSCILLQLSSLNPLKPDVKLRMKM